MLEGVKWYDDLTDHGREVMELLKDKEMWKGYIQPRDDRVCWRRHRVASGLPD